jgi:outer membrane protein
MNNRVFVWAAGALLACSAMVCAQATAQPPANKPAPPAQTPATQTPASNPPAGAASTATGAGKVATVHIQQAIAECAEGKKAIEDLQKRFAPKKDELERKGKEIQDLQEKLRQGEKVLSDEQRTALMRDIDRKTKAFNSDNDEATADYEQANSQVFNGIGNKMLQVIAAYSQRNGFDLVLNSAQPGEVLWQKQSVDITSEIIGAYNMAFPASGLTAPPPAPTGAPKPPAPSTPKKPQP